MKKNMIVLLIVLCILLFNAKEAYMSGAAWTELTLDEVIKNSNVIAVVKKNQPPFVVEDVPIDKDRQKFPPFKKQISIFEIVDILYKNDNAPQAASYENISLSPGKTIKVLQAGYDKEFNLHKRYYLENAMKTIEVDHYKDYNMKLEKSKECIVFLRYNQNEKMLEFTAVDSVEALKKKDEIIKYLGSDKSMKNVKAVLTEKEVLDIALPVLKESYGNFDGFKPWKAQYNNNGEWTVFGSLPELTLGGTPRAVVSDKDKKVISMYHPK